MGKRFRAIVRVCIKGKWYMLKKIKRGVNCGVVG